ncbi:hypothetical protein QBC34DRAFT_352971 [Podospora aff. communis PSN243]|uniref:CPAF-like PDZ domain-containing protein n=1 Tax=Podospora aff. communis PSN243 TaxID=3040156 RepID=A0AAV9GIS2_9PEZI|nr:hypothetical protein QBC34DRAFT_352971 [Podospora aff. communis PSN243]
MFTSALHALVASTLLGSSTAHPLCIQVPPREAEEPCKILRDTVAAWLRDHFVAPQNLTEIEKLVLPPVPLVSVKPSLALSRLKSMPLDKSKALAHVQYLKPFWEWQSTVDYLKNPPQGYLSEGVDLIRGTDDIAAKIRGDVYANGYEFLADLNELQSRVRDGHFGARNQVFDLWTTKFGKEFVSISQDGRTVPEIFLHDDVKHHIDGYKPSPVATIDGAPAFLAFQNLSARVSGSHDPDARYNSLFPSVSKAANLFNAGPEFFGYTIKDTSTVVLRNGSVITFDNVALVGANLTNVASGDDMHKDFVLGDGQGPSPYVPAMYKIAGFRYAQNFSQGGFPKPIARTIGGDAAWFLPETPSLQESAILAINSFGASVDIDNTPNPEVVLSIQAVLASLVAGAKAAGRTKLLIDLQGNGGGQLSSLAAVYDTLFPPDPSNTIFPLQSQARVHPQLTWLLTSPGLSTPARPLAWTFGTYRQLNGTAFPDVHSYLGPVTTPFGNITNPAYSDPRGFGPPSGSSQPPPFAPENIIILTDGECASACTMLVEVLTRNHNIRTVAVGGRPLLKPMQRVGRTKGGPAGSFGGFPNIDRATAPPGVDVVPATNPPLKLRASAGSLSRPNPWGEGIRFNVANKAPLGDAPDAIPLQFRYEAAHCKVFWTWEMARDIKAVWERVVDVAWGGGRCVEGSTTGEGGRIGREAPGYDEGVEDQAKLGPGPGSL